MKLHKHIWVLPLTICGLLYVSLCMMFGWIKFRSSERGVLFFTLTTTTITSKLFSKRWENRCGKTMGHIIVMKRDFKNIDVTPRVIHELEKFRQQTILGIFYPILYTTFNLAIGIVCKKSKARYTNPFEIEARRVAGQYVDMEGLHQKLKMKE